jgi:hypothetical protein
VASEDIAEIPVGISEELEEFINFITSREYSAAFSLAEKTSSIIRVLNNPGCNEAGQRHLLAILKTDLKKFLGEEDYRKGISPVSIFAYYKVVVSNIVIFSLSREDQQKFTEIFDSEIQPNLVPLEDSVVPPDEEKKASDVDALIASLEGEGILSLADEAPKVDTDIIFEAAAEEINFDLLKEEYRKADELLKKEIAFILTQFEKLQDIKDLKEFSKEILCILQVLKKIQSETGSTGTVLNIFSSVGRSHGKKIKESALEEVLQQLYSAVKKIMQEKKEGTIKMLRNLVLKLPTASDILRLDEASMKKEKQTLDKLGNGVVKRSLSLTELFKSTDVDSKSDVSIKGHLQRLQRNLTGRLEEKAEEKERPPSILLSSADFKSLTSELEALKRGGEDDDLDASLADLSASASPLVVLSDPHSFLPPIIKGAPMSSEPSSSSHSRVASSAADEEILSLLNLAPKIQNFPVEISPKLNEDLKNIRSAITLNDLPGYIANFILFLQHYFEVKETITSEENLEILIKNLNVCLVTLGERLEVGKIDTKLLSTALLKLKNAAHGDLKTKVEALQTGLMLDGHDDKNTEFQKILKQLQVNPFLNAPATMSAVDSLQRGVRLTRRASRLVVERKTSEPAVSSPPVSSSTSMPAVDESSEILFDESSEKNDEFEELMADLAVSPYLPLMGDPSARIPSSSPSHSSPSLDIPPSSSVARASAVSFGTSLFSGTSFSFGSGDTTSDPFASMSSPPSVKYMGDLSASESDVSVVLPVRAKPRIASPAPRITPAPSSLTIHSVEREIQILGDNNCAFNDAIIAMADAIVAGELDIDEDNDSDAVQRAKLIAQGKWVYLFTNSLPSSEGWDFEKIKQFFIQRETYLQQLGIQRFFAPLLRQKLQVILKIPAKLAEYKKRSEIPFIGAFDNYVREKLKISTQPADDIFKCCPDIKSQFEILFLRYQRLGIVVKGNEWSLSSGDDWRPGLEREWNTTLAAQFIQYIAKDQVWVGELELAFLFEEFGFNFRVNKWPNFVNDADYGEVTQADLTNSPLNLDLNMIGLLERSRIIKRYSVTGDPNPHYKLLVDIPTLERRLSAISPYGNGDKNSEDYLIREARGLLIRVRGELITAPLNPTEVKQRIAAVHQKDDIVDFYRQYFVEKPCLDLINPKALHWTCITQNKWLQNPTPAIQLRVKKPLVQAAEKTAAYLPSIYDVGVREDESIHYFRFLEGNVINGSDIARPIRAQLKDPAINAKLVNCLFEIFKKIKNKEIIIDAAEMNDDFMQAYRTWETIKNIDPAKKDEILEWFLTHIATGQIPIVPQLIALYAECGDANLYVWQKQPDRTIALVVNLLPSSHGKVGGPSVGLVPPSATAPAPTTHILETKNEEGEIIFKVLDANPVEELIYAPVYSVEPDLTINVEFSDEKCDAFADWRQIYFAIELMMRLQMRKNNRYKPDGREKYTANIENQKAVIEELFETAILGLPFLEQPRKHDDKRPTLVFNMLNLNGYKFDPLKHPEYFGENLSKLYYLWMAFKEIRDLVHVGRHAEHPRKFHPALERAKAHLEDALNHAEDIDYFTALDFNPNIKDKPTEHQERNSEILPNSYRELAILDGHLQVCSKRLKIEVHTRTDRARFWVKNLLFAGLPAGIGGGFGGWAGAALGNFFGFGSQYTDFTIFEAVFGTLGGVTGAVLLGVAGYYGLSRRIWHKRHIITKAGKPITEGEPVEFEELGNLSEPTKQLICKATGLTLPALERKFKRGHVALPDPGRKELAAAKFTQKRPSASPLEPLVIPSIKPFERPQLPPPSDFVRMQKRERLGPLEGEELAQGRLPAKPLVVGSIDVVTEPENSASGITMKIPQHIRPSRQHIPLVGEQHNTIRMGQNRMSASGIPLAAPLDAQAVADMFAAVANLELPPDEPMAALQEKVAVGAGFLTQNPELLRTNTAKATKLLRLLEQHKVRHSEGVEGELDLKELSEALNELPIFIPLELDETEKRNDQWKGVLRRLKKIDALYIKTAREKILKNNGALIEEINECIRKIPRNIDELSEAIDKLVKASPLIQFAVEGRPDLAETQASLESRPEPAGTPATLLSRLSTTFFGGPSSAQGPAPLRNVVVEGSGPDERSPLLQTDGPPPLRGRGSSSSSSSSNM